MNYLDSEDGKLKLTKLYKELNFNEEHIALLAEILTHLYEEGREVGYRECKEEYGYSTTN